MPNDEDVRERQQHLTDLSGRIRRYDRRTERYLSLSVQALTTIIAIWLIDWQMTTEGNASYYFFDLALDIIPLLAVAFLAFTISKLLLAYYSRRRASERYQEVRNEGAKKVITS
jgi:hypothetical protein